MAHLLRGLVWVVVGAGVYGYSLATDTPIVVRGTHVPWGLVVVGVGVLIMAWDSWKQHKLKAKYKGQ